MNPAHAAPNCAAPIRVVLSALLICLSLSLTACESLNYPDSETTPSPSARGEITAAAATPPTAASDAASTAMPDALAAPSAAARPATQNATSEFGVPETLPTKTIDEALRWNDLTRLARGLRLQGELDEANTRLAQAALQLSRRNPADASRRTVFSQRARLARELFLAGEPEAGELLADELFAEAEAGPAIGGASLVDLARDTIERRAKATDFDFSEEEELRLLALAFRSAQTGTATRARVNLSFEVASLAFHLDQIELARDAIDQAVLDARTTNPLDLDQEASLKVYKSRIALAQGDLPTAEAAARAAQLIFETIDTHASNRGVGEATLADVLNAKGETDAALELARTAYARHLQGEKLFEHAQRTIVSSLARAEASAGLIEDAQRHYREALAIPIENSALDERLEASIRREYEALN